MAWHYSELLISARRGTLIAATLTAMHLVTQTHVARSLSSIKSKIAMPWHQRTMVMVVVMLVLVVLLLVLVLIVLR